MEFVLQLIFEFFGELLLQLFGEMVGGAFKAAWYKLRGRGHELTAAQECSWSAMTGIAAGLLTVLVVPHLAIRLHWLQILNLLLAPLAAGLLVERLRAWRESRREFSVGIAAYAVLFGFAFALTRWLFGH